MRKPLCDALLARSTRPNMVFLTGDLGFMALEPLQAAMGERFINAGVAEQNMVSAAAAMASEGLEVWVYSIAPFCYARPFEQIRNDVTFHNLPVKLIGNGGGYGYGVMGPTHHAIEDYGVLLALPGMRVFVPVFDEDVPEVVSRVGNAEHPAYLRLGRGEPPADYTVPPYRPWRQLTSGGGMTVIAIGPLASTYIDVCRCLPDSARPNLWAVAELPIEDADIPAELRQQIRGNSGLCIAEEHVAHGGAASDFALRMARHGEPVSFHHVHARAHNYGRHGSQRFLRAQSGLDPETLLALVTQGR